MLNAYCVEIEKKIVSDYEDFDAAEDASFPENFVDNEVSKEDGDVALFGACRPCIFFINGFFCFIKINVSGMEKEE